MDMQIKLPTTSQDTHEAVQDGMHTGWGTPASQTASYRRRSRTGLFRR